MAWNAQEMAEILENLYNREFGGDYVAAYRLTWEQLRSIAGIDRLTDEYLAELGEALLDKDFALLTFNNIFIVAKEEEFSMTRALPARLAERNLFVEEDEDDDVEIEDDHELVDEVEGEDFTVDAEKGSEGE